MRFKRLDLNLLVAFDILLEERSVSAAARKLGLTQSAVSSILARLREFFRDDILIVQGRSMFATPFAESLKPQVKAFLQVAESLIATSTEFDPASSQRTFRIVASDFVVTALFAPMLRRLGKSAPHIAFEFILPDEAAQDKLLSGDIDLMITPQEFTRGSLAMELLYEERHVVVGCKDNPLFQRHLTESEVLNAPHVVVAIGAHRTPSFADQEMTRLGKSRRVEITVATFAMAPWFLVQSDRLGIMHERLAKAMAAALPIAYAPLPFAFPLMRQIMHYHPTRVGDEGLRWVRSQLKAQVEGDPLIAKIDRIRSTQ